MTAESRSDETRRDTLRCGVFVPPFCQRHADATLAIEREFELVEHLDRLGFDEAWIGEHHSGGTELIASPELFIAAAAERTQRIRLGTGVISLPYHHPMMVADRLVQLDHQTRGRAMFGFGSGEAKMQLYVTLTDLAAPQKPLYEAADKGDSGKKIGAAITMNPYVAAAKFVMEKNAPEKTVKKTAAEIAKEVETHLQ